MDKKQIILNYIIDVILFDQMSILITGGAGFIGSNFVHYWLENNNEEIINLDLLTYAGNLSNLDLFKKDSRHIFIKGNIADKEIVSNIFNKYNPRALINFAAESHVDRSIESPEDFINTNIYGTFNLLNCTKEFLKKNNQYKNKDFRFLHVSTDEVFGSLKETELPFTEENNYLPNSPYSASKASSDHLVRSFNKTYDIPSIITHCSNNYGPYQFPEKLIPLVINNALKHAALPLYGDGLNIRDWLYVKDHCSALMTILSNGRIGETYNIGGNNEKTNKEIIYLICDILDELKPIKDKSSISSYKNLIKYIKDRPGHDRRYAINSDKLINELNWKPNETLLTGIRKTIDWYLSNQQWINNIEEGSYREWISKQYCN